jgi:ABC-type transport system involved in cytochrome bd biosynthesis fused ATPase/permease subunit
VAVLGPSGCGKSSLIRAGVLAALQAGYMADDGPWKIITVQPGNGPLDAWKNKLRPHLREGRTEEEIY